jgi:hypothetical protein
MHVEIANSWVRRRVQALTHVGSALCTCLASLLQVGSYGHGTCQNSWLNTR